LASSLCLLPSSASFFLFKAAFSKATSASFFLYKAAFSMAYSASFFLYKATFSSASFSASASYFY
jgi:hypothetical protein